MRRKFSVPAAYRRAMEAAIALECDRIGRDILYRSEDDDVARFASIPATLIDPAARGVVEIIVDDGADVVLSVAPFDAMRRIA